MSSSIVVTPQSRQLPPAGSLRDACLHVITQGQGDPATRFEHAIRGDDGELLAGEMLVDRIRRMVSNRDAIESREKEVRRVPNLLTIEDYVHRHGADWSFDQNTVRTASASAEWFDRVAGFRRYI
jgi:hypothetical protein